STSPSCPILVRSLPTSPLFPYTTLFRSAAGTGLPTGLGRPPTDGDRRPGGTAGRGAVHQRGPTQPQRRSGRPCHGAGALPARPRSEEHTSELQSRFDLVCRLLLEKKNKK